jgi:two-component system, LytTR family, sensor kinase
MSSSSDRPARTAWRDLARWGLLFTVLGLITSVQQYVSMSLQNEAVTWPRVLIGRLPFWYLWALMAPGVAWLGRRFPIERGRVGSRGLLHSAFAFGLSLVHSSLLIPLPLLLLRSEITESFWLLWQRTVGGWLFVNLVVYGAILGASLAMSYYAKFRERELAASQLAEQLATAQLQALRMQLNPHFLFNAMNSIAMLVRKERNAEAVKMLAGLSALLRHVLEESGAHEVSLREELDFARRYLAIEEVRFQDRLQVRIDASDDTLDARVPNLLLQPLVENAVRHGIAKRVGAGLVEIIARRTGNVVAITIRDDGWGMNGARSDDDGGGVGLANTRSRLERLYGSAGRFELRDHPDGGAIATVTIPYADAPAAVLVG